MTSRTARVVEELPSAEKLDERFPSPRDNGLPARFRVFLSVLLLVAIYVAGYLTGQLRQKVWDKKMERTNLVPPGKPLRSGPWGKVSFVPIWISAPDEYLSVRLIETNNPPWFFKNFSADQLAELFNKASLKPEEKDDLLNRSRWKSAEHGITVFPMQNTVYSLAPESRQQIYSVIARWTENARQHAYLSFPVDGLKEQFDHSEVSEQTIALFKSLSYVSGKRLYFADTPLVLSELTDYEEKIHFLKAISRTPTMLLKLMVTPDSDVDELAKYWAKAGTGRDVRPLLESLQRVPNGVDVSISRLFPAWPTARLYNYPLPSLPPPAGPVLMDCHWTSFNFFRDPPDDRFADTRVVAEKIKEDYYPALSDPRYGDLVFLTLPNGDLIHSAVFIADNVVYTKNGSSFMQPWILSTLPELLDRYSFLSPREPLRVAFYRNKYF